MGLFGFCGGIFCCDVMRGNMWRKEDEIKKFYVQCWPQIPTALLHRLA